MAFDPTALQPLAFGNGFTLWHYTTADAKATVDTADYFLAAIKRLKLGDVIIANTSTGGTMETGLFAIKENNGTAIDVADLVTLSGGTDTD